MLPHQIHLHQLLMALTLENIQKLVTWYMLRGA